VLALSQRALFDGFDRERSADLMGAMDACNRRFGRGIVVPTAANVRRRRSWSIEFQMRTPSYTTRLDELPCVKGVETAGWADHAYRPAWFRSVRR
jgi:DNA polymerase V